MITGRHTSPDKGFSVEFDEHRMYVPGDDTRHLDWRLYAKSDRYMIKQYVEETNLRACLVVDSSESMAYAGTRAIRDPEGKPLSKFDVARRLAASLGFMLLRHQDATGLATFGNDELAWLPPGNRRGQLHHMLERLIDLQPTRTAPMAPLLHTLAERLPRRSMVMIVSDFFDDTDELLEALHHLQFRRHEIVIFHVMAEEERTFPFRESSSFVDLEDQANQLQIEPETLRKEYIAQVEAYLKTFQQGCGRMRADYLHVDTAQALEPLLAGFVSRRMERG